LYESIKEAEKVIDPENYDDMPLIPPMGKGGFEPSDEIEYFEKDMIQSDDDQQLSEEMVFVEKPNSSFNTQYKFYKKDFLNENKKYILDLNSITFVINPNSL